jgi:hypothetical protein
MRLVSTAVVMMAMAVILMLLPKCTCKLDDLRSEPLLGMSPAM